jgi:kumamolisin
MNPIANGMVPKSAITHVSKEVSDKSITTSWIFKLLTSDQMKQIIAELEQNQFVVSLVNSLKLKVTGLISQFGSYLNTEFHTFMNGGTKEVHMATVSDYNIQNDLIKDNLVGILGLHTFPVVAPYYKMSSASKDVAPKVETPLTPLQIASLYHFPTGLNGSGVKVGIIELGGGYTMSDVTNYLKQLSVTGTPNITAVAVDGASNDPSDTSGANVEVILDIDVIVALVPQAAIRVYFCPNTDQGFYDGIQNAINDGCSVISISWGGPESSWSSQTMASYNALFESAYNQNVMICVAAGDNGSSDGASGNNVDFPASSPYVLACGGTNLQGSNATITSEKVWNDGTDSATGGGLSNIFTIPDYQGSVSFNLKGKRGVPDVAGNADPNTGYIIYYQGKQQVVGGTSAVAPLWTALLTMIVQQNKSNSCLANLHQKLYGTTDVFRDITSGNNGSFSAGVGWDACTGNGSPIGQSVMTLLSGTGSTTPAISFTGTPVSGTVPLTVAFTDTTNDSSTTGWAWDFGDSGTSTAKSPTHVYSNVGSYTVSLTTIGTSTNTLTKTNYITVTAPIVKPVASFTTNVQTGEKPLTVNFTDTSTGGPTSWLWSFGDRTTSTLQNPSHTYKTAGSYNVSLKVTNNDGYNIINHNGYIRVTNPPVKPVANFRADFTTGKAPFSVNFKDISSNNPTSWLWNFGDGETSTLKTPTHTYSKIGSYTVSLTASNSAGSSTISKTQFVKVENLVQVKPTASFTVNPIQGPGYITAKFTDTSSNKPTKWLWNFGNNTTSIGQNPIVNYTKKGNYTVTLTVTNAHGSSSVTKLNCVIVQ